MLSLEQNYHYERGINLEIYSKVTHNMESDINFIKKIIDMVKNYNESLRENNKKNMQNIELSKEEMSVIYDMRAKEAEEENKKKYIENYIKISLDYKKWLTKNDCSDDLGKFRLFLSEYENGRSRLLNKNIEDIYYGIENIFLEVESKIKHLFNKG